MKERITVTVDEDIITAIDARVDGNSIKSRSHAFELLLRQSLQGRAPRRALILAAGKDEEMLPLTQQTPKCMLEVQGKPLLLHNLELLKRFGVTEAIINVGQHGQQIIDRFGDGAAIGIAISYLHEDLESPLGTAGPIRKLKELLDGESFLVLNSDELKDVNLERMYREHLRNGGTGTIALTTVDDPSRYGVALLEGNKIMRFIEKPAPGTEMSRLINTGLYIFEPAIIEHIPEGFALLTNDVLPKIARDGKLYGYPIAGQWLSPERPEHLSLLEQQWKGFRM